jgi:methionyl-tRNA formyltransferase
LIGGNRQDEDGPLVAFALAARRRGLEVVVVSEPLHLDLATADGRPLRALLAEHGIEPVEMVDLDAGRIAEIAGPHGIGLLVNAVWIIRRPIIEAFGGRLYNYHPARLPEERGAACYSWKILLGNRDGGLTIHEVTERLDDGDIILDHRFRFPDECRTCMDFYRFMAPVEERFFNTFLDGILGGTLQGRAQDESQAIYWPRLNTNIHGWVDWRWSAADLQTFTEAFDAPHPGASTFLDSKRVRLKSCRAVRGLVDFHPFQAGLIFRKSEEGVFVATCEGALMIGDLRDDAGVSMTRSVRLGSRLVTPSSELEQAQGSRVIVRADGVTVKPPSY